MELKTPPSLVALERVDATLVDDLDDDLSIVPGPKRGPVRRSVDRGIDV